MNFQARTVNYLGYGVLLFLHAFFIYTITCNTVIYDETRIVVKFMEDYLAAPSLLEKLRALFASENESFPALIRYMYLLTYQLTGFVNFAFLGYLGNFLPLAFLGVFVKNRRQFRISLLWLLPLFYFLLNPFASHIYEFTYASWFYFISVLFPVLIFYYFSQGNDRLAILLFVLLGLSSSSYTLCGLLLIFMSLLTRRYKAAGVWLGIILVIYAIPTLFLGLHAETSNDQMLWKNFSHIPELLSLFFITLGSWVIIFNSALLNGLVFYIGLLGFLFQCFFYFRVYRREGFSPLWLFFTINTLYLWIVFGVTTVFRWNLNYDYQYGYIMYGHKSFFVLTYTFLSILSIFTFSNYRRAIRGLAIFSVVFVMAYLRNYYDGYTQWSYLYKNKDLAKVNINTYDNRIEYRNLTYFSAYGRFLKEGLFQPEETPFDDIAIEDLIKNGKVSVNQNTGITLLENAERNQVNMYNISNFPIILYSYNYPFPGKAMNRKDGVYLYLSSATDKLYVPFKYNRYIFRNFLTTGKYYSDWMVLTFDNSIGLDLVEATYDLYLVHVVNGQFDRCVDIRKVLKIQSSSQIELLDKP